AIQAIQRLEQQRPALLHRHAVRLPLLALPPRFADPLSKIAARKQFVESLTNQRRQTRRISAGRDGDGDAVAADHAAQKRRGIRGIVDGVDEDSSRLGRGGHVAIHLWRRRSDDEPRAVEILRYEWTSIDEHSARRAAPLDLFDYRRRDDMHFGRG